MGSTSINILLPSLSKRKCGALSLRNRAPEAELDAKMDAIRRDHARFKLNTRANETKLWDELYKNHRDLKASFVSKHSYEDVMSNEELYRVPRDARKHPITAPDIPFAEAYKQFVVFRAKTMVEMYGPTGSKYFNRPRYADLYEKTANLKLKNSRSMEKIRLKYEDKQKENEKVLHVLNSQTEADKQTTPEMSHVTPEVGRKRGRKTSIRTNTPANSRPSLSRHSTRLSNHTLLPSNTPEIMVSMVTQFNNNNGRRGSQQQQRSRTEDQLQIRRGREGPNKYSLDKMPTITISPKAL